jgi:hypothetical protein
VLPDRSAVTQGVILLDQSLVKLLQGGSSHLQNIDGLQGRHNCFDGTIVDFNRLWLLAVSQEIGGLSLARR